MSTENKKTFLQRIKGMFDGTVPLVAPTPKVYKTKDGAAELTITQAGETPAASDTVTIAGAPAPAADYVLEDGSTLTVDANGVITAVVAAAPVTQSADELAAAAAAAAKAATPAAMSMDDIKGLMAGFATGTPEERIANLEIMVKALMECNFGWKIREGQEDAAILAYKESMAPTVAAVADTTTQLAAANQKIQKFEIIIPEMFALVEQILETPTEDPKTLTGTKKEKFDRAESKDSRLEKMAAALREARGKKAANPAQA